MKKTYPYFIIAILLSSNYLRAESCQNNIPPYNPSDIYIVHGNGTATDTRTGLMWKQCSEGQTWNDSDCVGVATGRDWSTALLLSQGTAYAGYHDWRLPNIKELSSLVERCRVNPSINETVFPNMTSVGFWSNSPKADSPADVWLVAFSHGGTLPGYHGLTYGVRLVRTAY